MQMLESKYKYGFSIQNQAFKLNSEKIYATLCDYLK
jgi:hypothetical protein